MENSNTNVQTIKPEKCHLWDIEYLKEDRNLSVDFDQLFTYIDDSHLIRRLLKCKDCGQLYFYEFYEEIDWINGKDPQYRKWIPIKSKADADILSKVTIFEIFTYLPQLQSNWPSEAISPVFQWVGK